MPNTAPEGLSYLVDAPSKSLAHHKVVSSRRKPLRAEGDGAEVQFPISGDALQKGPR